MLLSGHNPRLAAGQRTLVTPEPRVQIMPDDHHDDHHQTAGAQTSDAAQCLCVARRRIALWPHCRPSNIFQEQNPGHS